MCVWVNAQGVLVKLADFDAIALVDRLSFAFGLAVARHRLQSQGEMAKLLAERSGVTIKASAVSRWLAGSRPSLEHIVALAALAGVDPGWLAVGDLSQAPIPESYLPPKVIRRTGQRRPPPGGGGAQEKRA
jgi:hypothetical protein